VSLGGGAFCGNEELFASVLDGAIADDLEMEAFGSISTNSIAFEDLAT
jgi:hypothetical protein